MSESSGPDPALQRLFEEALRTVDRQLRVDENIDSKAAEVLRFDALALSILLTGASVGVRTDLFQGLSLWLGVPLVVGFFLLMASAFFALRCYRLADSRVGVQADDLVRARAEGASEEEVLDAGLRGYAEGIRSNAGSIDRSARRLRASLRSLWIGLAMLSVGTAILMLVGVT